MHTDYLEADANNKKYKKINIIKKILDEPKIKDNRGDRRMMRRLIVRTTFKPWIKGGEEEKALKKWLYKNINTAVLGDEKTVKQTRKQIMNEFKEQFPANEHNDYDITNKISSIVNYIKRTKQRPVRVKPKKSRSMEARQIKSVQQATSQVMENQMRFDKVTGNYNDLFPQSKDPVAVNNINEATFDEIQKKISNMVELIKDFTKEQSRQ